MTIFLTADGKVALCLPSTITQGSNNANKIVLIGPFDQSNVITVAFSLQNGKTYGPRLVDPYTTEEIDLSSLKSDAYAMTPSEIPGYTVDGAVLYAWTYTLNSVLLSCSGTLNIQFFITDADGETKSSQLIQATINPGIKNITLPETPPADVYDDIKYYLTHFNVDIVEIKKAKEYADAAKGSAQAAEGSKSAAATSASEAEGSKSAAATSAEEAEGSKSAAATSAEEAKKSAHESRMYADQFLGWDEVSGEPSWDIPDRWRDFGDDKLYELMKEIQSINGNNSALYYAIDAAISKELAGNSATTAGKSATKAEKNASDISDIEEDSATYPGLWLDAAEAILIRDGETDITEYKINQTIKKCIADTANGDIPNSGKKSALFYAIDAYFSSEYAKAAIVAEMSRVANTVKGVVSGSTVIMTDVSPISHTMAVKIKPKNILPYPYTAFVEAGSNDVTINGVTFTNNGDGTITANGTATATTNLVLYDLADENRLKFDNSSLVLSGSIGGRVGRVTKYGLSMTTYLADGTEKKVTQFSTSEKLPDGCSSSSKLQIFINSGVTVSNVVFKPQLEYGSEKTDYEALIADITTLKVIQKNADDEVVAEYTPNSDGTVGGVTSLYPTTVLTTDNGTVPIECEYNRDTNKAIPKLYRHDIQITKDRDDYDSEGNITASDQPYFKIVLAVYRSTAEPLTLDDISTNELRGAKAEFFYLWDMPEGMRIVANVFYIESTKTFSVYYYTDITTASSEALDCDQYNYKVSDTVTEV